MPSFCINALYSSSSNCDWNILCQCHSCGFVCVSDAVNQFLNEDHTMLQDAKGCKSSMVKNLRLLKLLVGGLSDHHVVHSLTLNWRHTHKHQSSKCKEVQNQAILFTFRVEWCSLLQTFSATNLWSTQFIDLLTTQDWLHAFSVENSCMHSRHLQPSDGASDTQYELYVRSTGKVSQLALNYYCYAYWEHSCHVQPSDGAPDTQYKQYGSDLLHICGVFLVTRCNRCTSRG